jgi:hypothetical protein
MERNQPVFDEIALLSLLNWEPHWYNKIDYLMEGGRDIRKLARAADKREEAES